MHVTRREAIVSALFGAGSIGLRALATGLPASVLLNPRTSLADACASRERAQYLIWATSGSGDPSNANVPGTYDDPGIAHSLDPAMAPTPMTLSGKTYTAAKPWASLPQAVLDRACFFHHTTLTNSHANEGKVLKLMGAVKRQEMLISLLAKNLAPCLSTVQAEPASISGEVITFGGRILPALTPVGLRDVFVSPKGPLTNLQALRDADLDRVHEVLKQSGNSIQRSYLERMANSKNELRNISDSLLANLSNIRANDLDGQLTAAVSLIQMNVSPASVIFIPFGGDNHSDANLARETAQHVSGCGAIATLMQRLATAKLQDRVTFVLMNVFGRSLNRPQRMGRDHLGNHHCSVIIGKRIRGSVVGGVVKAGNDYAATPIDSKTGLPATAGADIRFEETLGAVGKTIAAAVGLSSEVLNDQITTGKIVQAALTP
ncbi:MAG: DUF1501 domain-containing protein [Myxococcales bacterium]|nr:DUF1501 domain-containing protein [Myxococcales bacterium]